MVFGETGELSVRGLDPDVFVDFMVGEVIVGDQIKFFIPHEWPYSSKLSFKTYANWSALENQFILGSR